MEFKAPWSVNPPHRDEYNWFCCDITENTVYDAGGFLKHEGGQIVVTTYGKSSAEAIQIAAKICTWQNAEYAAKRKG